MAGSQVTRILNFAYIKPRDRNLLSSAVGSPIAQDFMDIL